MNELFGTPVIPNVARNLVLKMKKMIEWLEKVLYGAT